MSDRLPQGDKPAPRDQPPVTEREPLTIVVVDAPPAVEAVSSPTTADVRVRAKTVVRVYPETRRRRLLLALLVIVGAGLLWRAYHKLVEPVAVRFAHGIERRVLSESSYNALHERRARPAKIVREHHRKHERPGAKVAVDRGTEP